MSLKKICFSVVAILGIAFTFSCSNSPTSPGITLVNQTSFAISYALAGEGSATGYATGNVAANSSKSVNLTSGCYYLGAGPSGSGQALHTTVCAGGKATFTYDGSYLNCSVQ